MTTPLPSPGARALAWTEALAAPAFSEETGALTRRYLTPAHAAALEQVGAWMREAGMAVRIDAAGTIVGRYEGTSPGLPAVMLGSHLDTVRNAGRYDGNLGVMLGIACVADLARRGVRLPFAIEVAGFGDEEGSRFHTAMIGSGALAGIGLPNPADVIDAEGVSLSAALTSFGLDPDKLAAAKRERRDLLAFIEPHIEQGPLLEAEDLAVGVVTAIAGQTRIMVRVTGEARHAGTTPMGLRRDALTAAAAMVVAVETAGRQAAGHAVVATVGALTPHPGASNVIPGAATFTVDVRAPRAEDRDAVVADVLHRIEVIAAERDVGLHADLTLTLAPCRMSQRLQDGLAAAIAAEGIRPFSLASGAGHDAMAIARLTETAMLFIRCRDGLSHNPAESVRADDVETAARVLLRFIETFPFADLTP